MISNMTCFLLDPSREMQSALLEPLLMQASFTPCAASQEVSSGWTPPRDQDNASMLETVAGQWVFQLTTERRVVPGAAIQRSVAEKIKHIEASTGLKVGRKQLKELKEDAKLALLPQAFSKISNTLVWVNPSKNLLVVDSASIGRVDEVVTLIVKTLDIGPLTPLQTALGSQVAMVDWLNTGAPADFTIDQDCELKSLGESKAVVRYSHLSVDTAEVRQQMAQGMVPTRLGLTWAGKVSFWLTSTGAIKRIRLLETAAPETSREGKADHFDADLAIATADLSGLIEALVDRLGGASNPASPIGSVGIAGDPMVGAANTSLSQAA